MMSTLPFFTLSTQTYHTNQGFSLTKITHKDSYFTFYNVCVVDLMQVAWVSWSY